MSSGTTTTIPLAAWPSRDRLRWLAALQPTSILDDANSANRWADSTKRGIRQAYGRWLGWLRTHHPDDLRLHFTKRPTPRRVTDYCTFMKSTAANASVVVNLMYLIAALRVMAPRQDWSALRRGVTRLARQKDALGPKRPKLVHPQALFELGLRLMASCGFRADIGTWQQAIQYRDGLMIALLATRPFRSANFISMKIGEHLLEHAGGTWLRFRATETKNKSSIECPFPTRLKPQLNRYMKIIRPFLSFESGFRSARNTDDNTNGHVWVARTGHPLEAKGFYKLVTMRTSAAFGHSVNPHLFRDCLATEIADSNVNHASIVPVILGHWHRSTSERYYSHIDGGKAVQRFQDHVVKLRRQAALARG
jgi:integrase/recombinase XerD